MAKWLDKYDAPQAKNGIEGTMGGLTDVGFNYNGAWGGPSMQVGGNIMPAMAGANQTVPMAQTGIRQSVTANPQDYKKWQDSVANYQQGLRELAAARQKASTNINNYSLLNPTNLVSTFGNLLFGDEKGSRRAKPTYKEVSVPKSTGWYRPNDPEQQPMNYVAIGDPFFDTGYELSNLGVKSEFDDDRNALAAGTSMYSPYGSFVALYHPPVRQNLVLQELKGRSSKPQPKPKPPRKLEKPKLDSLDIPDIKLTDVRPSIAQPKFEQTKVDEQKPTKYSYTYPTGKYLEEDRKSVV